MDTEWLWHFLGLCRLTPLPRPSGYNETKSTPCVMSPGADLAGQNHVQVSMHLAHVLRGGSLWQVWMCVYVFFLIKLVETPGEFFSEPTTSKQTLNAWLAVDTRTCFSRAAWKLCRLRPARMAAVCLTSQFMALLLGNNEEEGTISQPQRMPLKIRGLSEVSRHLRMFFSACTLLPLSSELTCRS